MVRKKPTYTHQRYPPSVPPISRYAAVTRVKALPRTSAVLRAERVSMRQPSAPAAGGGAAGSCFGCMALRLRSLLVTT